MPNQIDTPSIGRLRVRVSCPQVACGWSEVYALTQAETWRAILTSICPRCHGPVAVERA